MMVTISIIFDVVYMFLLFGKRKTFFPPPKKTVVVDLKFSRETALKYDGVGSAVVLTHKLVYFSETVEKPFDLL